MLKKKKPGKNYVTSRNTIPSSIFTHLEACIAKKEVPTEEECLEVLNKSPGLRNYRIEELMTFVSKAIIVEEGWNDE